MNYKMLFLAVATALTLGACAHRHHGDCGKCGSQKEQSKDCKDGECAMDKKCDDCKKPEGSSK